MKKCQRSDLRFCVKPQKTKDRQAARIKTTKKLKRLKEIYALKKLIMPKAPHNTSQYLMDLHPVIEFNCEELLGSTRDYIEEFLEVLVLPD